MALKEELSLPKGIRDAEHEAVLNIVYTGELLAKEATRLLRDFGLTQTQLNVLMLLGGQSDDGCLGQTDLGRMLLVNRSNVTGLIDRMEEAGWVRRAAADEDRRVKVVCLTAEGRRLLDEATEAYFDRLSEVMSGLDESGCREICRLMERVRQGARRAKRRAEGLVA